MSLLKTMIPMSMFTWGPGGAERERQGQQVPSGQGPPSPRWELEVREKAKGNDDLLGSHPSLDAERGHAHTRTMTAAGPTKA